jgi:hypothetical protein
MCDLTLAELDSIFSSLSPLAPLFEPSAANPKVSRFDHVFDECYLRRKELSERTPNLEDHICEVGVRPFVFAFGKQVCFCYLLLLFCAMCCVNRRMRLGSASFILSFPDQPTTSNSCGRSSRRWSKKLQKEKNW